MEMKRFTQNNNSFECLHCKAFVAKHPSSSRDHCTECLYSLHVDNFPGDRANTCLGLLVPLNLRTKSGKEQITYQCEKCRARMVNIVAPDDNRDTLLELTLLSF